MVRTKASTSPVETQRERDHGEIAYRAALESVVLLENDGALPLQPCRVALYGSGARKTVKGGSGSGEVNERRTISVEEGLESAGFTVTTKAWLDDYDTVFDRGEAAYGEDVARQLRRLKVKALAEVFANPYRYPAGRPIVQNDIAASATDTCVYVVARQAGEGGDRRLERDDYHLSHEERDNLRRCAEAYKRTIVVLNVGSSFDASFVAEIGGINAVLSMCQLGSMGGRALADLLTGKATPSGKLTDTWARSYDDIPFSREFGYLNGDLVNEVYREGIYVGYRYFDTFGVAPAYPFGYGLSYTSFQVAAARLVADGMQAKVTVTVTNTGDIAGKEVVQLYVSCPRTGLAKEAQVLAGFAKTQTLGPGQSEEVPLQVDVRLLASYHEKDARYLLDAGDYVLRVGRSSRDTTPVGVLVLDEQAVVSQHMNVCRPVQPIQELAASDHDPFADEDLSRVPRMPLDTTQLSTLTHAYIQPPVLTTPSVDPLMDALTIEELTRLVAGVGMMYFVRGGGNTHYATPGAGGSTTDSLVDKGIPNVTLADGPAGLRLQKRSVMDRKGRLKPLGTPVDIFKHFPALFDKLVLGDPVKGTVHYQFATAFPVENALAQTWNESLLEEVGAAVGVEMAEFGVTYWLAPGINIHRNPLCGRNFEYYSEDPLLSGKMAAALTRGVQRTEGCYVTLKHFVANEREDNRNRADSQVGERALREIYLRPFEIAVREADAKAVMTSYNLVNGTYTANSHDLCTKVLRNEWGFDGVVMTDWGATGKFADSALCLKAGNDLLMPGGGAERRRVLKGLKSGAISETDLRRCAANVLRSIVSSGVGDEPHQG